MQKAHQKKTAVRRHKGKVVISKKSVKQEDIFSLVSRTFERAMLQVFRALSAPELVPAKAAVRRTRAPRRKK